MSKERAAALVDAGVFLQLAGDLNGARDLFKRALTLDPLNAKAKHLFVSAGGVLPPEPAPVPKAPTVSPKPPVPSAPPVAAEAPARPKAPTPIPPSPTAVSVGTAPLKVEEAPRPMVIEPPRRPAPLPPPVNETVVMQTAPQPSRPPVPTTLPVPPGAVPRLAPPVPSYQRAQAPNLPTRLPMAPTQLPAGLGLNPLEPPSPIISRDERSVATDPAVPALNRPDMNSLETVPPMASSLFPSRALSRPAPATDIEQQLNEVDAFMRARAYDKALERVLQVVRADPENLSGHEKAYAILRASGNESAAADQLINVLRLFVKKGSSGRATEYLELLRRERPDHPELPKFSALLGDGNETVMGLTVEPPPAPAPETPPDSSADKTVIKPMPKRPRRR
jgi:tetratricopeptide (TPR) repeat protein